MKMFVTVKSFGYTIVHPKIGSMMILPALGHVPTNVVVMKSSISVGRRHHRHRLPLRRPKRKVEELFVVMMMKMEAA